MLNTRASADARYARSGKDSMLYNEDGEALAQVDSFQTKAAFNNNKYNPKFHKLAVPLLYRQKRLANHSTYKIIFSTETRYY